MMKQSASSRDAEEMCSHRTSCDAELAKALKTFYQNMSVVREQFLQLKHSRPPVSLFFCNSLSIRGCFPILRNFVCRNLKMKVSQNHKVIEVVLL